MFLFVTAALGLSALSFTASAQDNDPVELFNKGQDAHEKRDYKTALALYEKAIQANPEFPEAEYQKGSVLLLLGNAAKAEAAFLRAAELRPDWALPVVELGGLAIRNKRFIEAKAFLDKSLQLDPKNETSFEFLTELFLQTKVTGAVITELLGKIKQLTALGNASASIWASQAALERTTGDLSSAAKSIARALVINPNSLAARTQQIELLFEQKNFSAALESALFLLKLSPDSPITRMLLARAYVHNGQTDEAKKIVDTLDSKDPDVAALKTSLSVNTENDIAFLEKQLEENEKNVAVLGRLCVVTRKIPAKALDYCKRAYDLEPTNIGHAIGYGAALVQARQFGPAVTLLSKILQIEPENYAAHANLAAALFELKRFAEAQREYTWITKVKPDLAITYYFLAITHDNLGEYQQALIDYQNFLRLADANLNQLEIDKVNLRLPGLQRQIKEGRGVKKDKKT